MSLGNCVVFAVRLYVRRVRRWRRAGMPKGQEPYLLFRPSRSNPRWIPHTLVGVWRGGRMQVVSYKPTRPEDVRWWNAWRRWRFDGHTGWGDL